MRAEHLTDGDVAGYLDGDLSPDERSRVEAHMESCAPCRAVVVDVMRAVDTAGAAPTGRVDGGRRAPRWQMGAMGLAAAAGLAAILLLRPGDVSRTEQTQRAPSPVLSEARRSIEVVAPADSAPVDRRRVTFVWRKADADLYRLLLLTDNGEPIWSRETPDTSLVLPATVRLDSARSYFWRVDGVSTGITTSTGARALRTR